MYIIIIIIVIAYQRKIKLQSKVVWLVFLWELYASSKFEFSWQSFINIGKKLLLCIRWAKVGYEHEIRDY